MKKITIPVLLLLFAFNAAAQKEYDSIKRVIEDYNGATNIIIPNVRQLMMEKLDSNDIPGARKIYDYAVNVLAAQGIISFYDYERVLLAYILLDEQFLRQHIQHVNNGFRNGEDEYYRSVFFSRSKRFSYPGNDHFYADLNEYTIANFEIIRKQIPATTQLSAEETGVLAVYLRFRLFDNKKEEFSATTIEKDIRKTLGSNYHGLYKALVNTVMLENITPTALHFSFEAGGGVLFRGQDLRHYLPTTIGIYFLTGVTYKKTVLELSFMENGSKLRKTLPVKNEIWREDSSVITHNAFATLGYSVVDNARWNIYPFAGATMAWMQPEYNGPTQSKKTVVGSGAGIIAGVAIQLKNKRWSYRYSTRKGGDAYNYCGLRLSYATRNFNDPALRSNTFQCTLSIMGHFGERVFFLPWSWFNGMKKGIVRS